MKDSTTSEGRHGGNVLREPEIKNSTQTNTRARVAERVRRSTGFLSRRSFLSKSLAVGAGTIGAGLLANAPTARATKVGDRSRDDDGGLTAGDEAILRFLPIDRNIGTLQTVAAFEKQVVGVAVSASGRVFVSFPRNGIDTVKRSVAEVINGNAVAYPNKEINTLNTAEPSTHFLSAQSVYVDSSDTLWVLDVGNLGSGTALISGGAKLVAIDLTTNAVKRTIVFPDSLITKGTSINDVRFDLARGAAGFAYIPDSSAAAGSGIIVVDLSTGNAVRRLANDPTVLPDPAFRATVEGKPFVIQATADAAPSLVSVACDGIAVSADGKLVYYCPIASRNLYSVDAAVLTDFTQSDAAVAATIENLGDKGEVGGLEADAQGRVYLTNGEFNAILRFDPSQGTGDTFNPTFETVVHNRHLVWPDSLALGKDGTLYITSTQVNRLPVFNAGQDLRQPPYILYKVQTDATPGRR
jgi:sugar lactone lactonase YvrE